MLHNSFFLGGSMTDVPATSIFDAARDAYGSLDGPVIVYNKSHSGSRLLARLLEAGGVFMGAHRNESEDSLEVLALVDYLVRSYYPDYSGLWASAGDLRDVAQRARACFDGHLEGFARTSIAPWGWKLCESAYALPVLARAFPHARVIHLVRDGRDVAFCDHRGPDDPFWRKIYFNTDRMDIWRGMRLTGPSYRRRSHLFNAVHWSNAVRVGRAYGSMLRERYLEVRYEALCTDFAATARRVLQFARAPEPESAIDRIGPLVQRTSIGKHRRAPAGALRDVMAIAKPDLLAFGYLERDPERQRASVRYSRFVDDFIDRRRTGTLLASWSRYLPRQRRSKG
jgi:hypothetical protein